MNTIKGSGKYIAPDKQVVPFSYDYPEYESVQDAVACVGEPKTLSLINRMAKMDVRNSTSITTQSANGHSRHVAMTAEQKEASKAKRAELASYARMVQDLKEGKISLDELAETLKVR